MWNRHTDSLSAGVDRAGVHVERAHSLSAGVDRAELQPSCSTFFVICLFEVIFNSPASLPPSKFLIKSFSFRSEKTMLSIFNAFICLKRYLPQGGGTQTVPIGLSLMLSKVSLSGSEKEDGLSFV